MKIRYSLKRSYSTADRFTSLLYER